MVVNAVVKAFVEEVVGEEEMARRKRLLELEKLYEKINTEINSVRKAARRQAEAMNASQSQPPLLDVEVARQEYTRLRLQELKLEAALAVERERSANAAKPDDDPSDAAKTGTNAGAAETLSRELQLVREQARAIAEEIRPAQKIETATGVLSLDLQDYERELRRHEKLADAIGEKMDRLEIELESPIGIQIYREAVPNRADD